MSLLTFSNSSIYLFLPRDIYIYIYTLYYSYSSKDLIGLQSVYDHKHRNKFHLVEKMIV